MNSRLIRRGSHAFLAAVLLIGAAAAWTTLNALDGKAGDLVRYVQVDAWTTQQTESRSYQFLLALSEHVAGNEASTRKGIRRHLNKLKTTAAYLNINERSPAVQALPGKQDLRSDFTKALLDVDSLLAAHGDIRGNIGLLLDVKAILEPWMTSLQTLMVNLTHIRLALQKRDLTNASRLITINRFLLLAIIGVGAAFITLATVEAQAARKAEAVARTDRGRFQDFAETASDWLWETDSELRLTFVSDQIEAFSGMPAASYLGLPVNHLILKQDQEGDTSSLDEAIQQKRPFRNLFMGFADEQRFLRISGNPTHDENDSFLGFRGSCTDISEEVKREGRIRFLAEHDHLTGLSNRAFLQTQLRAILQGDRLGDHQGVLLVLDLDGFKDINDTFGHDTGDALIVAVGDRLKSELRRTDLLARLGGDEFAIVHRDDDGNHATWEALAARLLKAVKQPFKIAGFEFSVGTSIGMAKFPADGTTVEALMKAADLALYAAKAAEGDCAATYHPDMSERLKRRRRLEQDLRRALDHDELELHIQPQVDITSNAVIGGEALLRWKHAELGPISPDVFIPIAEETGLILPLGRWVMDTACAKASQWSSTLGDGLIAVNVSPAQFTHQDLVCEVTDVLDRTGLKPENLELEITEGLLMRDHQLAINTLGRLDDMGVKLAIDDFGTGYSSLSYLKRFRVHKVKIDKAFVQNLEHDSGDHTIVRAVVMMSQAFGFQTIAEGVETAAQRDRLVALGCDQAQGYLYGKPRPIDAFFQTYAAIEPAPATIPSLAMVSE
ncbi:MAG: putative bifunctional diguanylate cyclase/phosphodiesterase [Geminicoccaceae bacterium]